jgi:hypothetical protein
MTGPGSDITAIAMSQPDDRPQAPVPPDPSPTGRQVYNLVTDTVAGPNVRLRDNLYQAAITGLCLVLGIPIGWLVARLTSGNPQDQIGFAIVGAFAGLVVGLLGSGTFLMFFRAIQHMRGKHD